MTTTCEQGLMAALRQNLAILRELAQRYEVSTIRDWSESEGARITLPEDAGRILAAEMEPLVQEQLRVLLLDSQNRVTGHHLVYQGNVNASVIRPAEVFREALLANAPRIIVGHNHPSGDPEPSNDDIVTTGYFLETGRILGIEVLDHIIIGRRSIVSMHTRGLPSHSVWPAI